MRNLLLIFVLIALIGLGFFIGKWFSNQSAQTIVNQSNVVKEIAELGALEVQGEAKLSETNVQNGGIWNTFKNFLSENTLVLNIPYQAKYGIVIPEDSTFISVINKTTVLINLPNPTLLSFEMRLDKTSQFSKNGFLVLDNENRFQEPQKQLYAETKNSLTNDKANINKAKVKIEKILTNLMQLQNLTVKFNWK